MVTVSITLFSSICKHSVRLLCKHKLVANCRRLFLPAAACSSHITSDSCNNKQNQLNIMILVEKVIPKLRTGISRRTTLR